MKNLTNQKTPCSHRIVRSPSHFLFTTAQIHTTTPLKSYISRRHQHNRKLTYNLEDQKSQEEVEAEPELNIRVVIKFT